MFDNIIAKGFNDEKTKEKSKRLSIIRIMENIDMGASEKLDSIDRLFLKSGWIPPEMVELIRYPIIEDCDYHCGVDAWRTCPKISDPNTSCKNAHALAILKGEK